MARPAHWHVSDNGTELTSKAILEWAYERGFGWNYTAPGKPQQSGFSESFEAGCAANS